MASPQEPLPPGGNTPGPGLPPWPPGTAGGLVGVRRSWFPRWRIFTWVILAFNLIMLIWLISGIASGESCSGKTGDELTTCEAGQVGTGIGVFLIIVLWALGDVILGVLWLVTRPRRRDCPVCGNGVRRGVTQCPKCGYDFSQLLQRSPTASQAAQPTLGPDGRYYSSDGAFAWNGSAWVPARRQ
jgi:hypothetical protein